MGKVINIEREDRLQRLITFLEEETDDWSHIKFNIKKEEDKSDDDESDYEVEYCLTDHIDECTVWKALHFKVDDDKVYIEVSEDNWEEVNHYDNTVRWFWIVFEWK